jgi:MFS family permease
MLKNVELESVEEISMNQIRLAMLIQLLNSFVVGALTIILPLMMKERNIDIVTIGLVYAAMPMIFQLGRMLFAVLSDFWGRKPFFVLHGLLAAISNLVYYVAQTPMQFLSGKIVEGTKDGSLWAVNRAFLMEHSENKWRILVHLRTTTYTFLAIGSLMAGFLVVWLQYDGALLACAFIGALGIMTSLLLIGGGKGKLSKARALVFLDFRKKQRIFKSLLVLFFVMGLSSGFVSNFVFPLFLSKNGFDPETIGLFLGLQISLSGMFSYLFAGRTDVRRILLLSGALYLPILVMLGFFTGLAAAMLVIAYGIAEGLLSIGQEGVLARSTSGESYGTDIGLLTTGLHSGRATSLAVTGFLISLWGYPASFLASAVVFAFFFLGVYSVLET